MTETQPSAPADEALYAFLGYRLKRASSFVKSDLVQTLMEFDLRIASFSALMVVVARPGITQTELAEALAIERSNLVQIVDELCAGGLIARTPFPGDRRRHALMPTGTGLATAVEVKTAVLVHEDRAFGNLNLQERQELARILTKLRGV